MCLYHSLTHKNDCNGREIALKSVLASFFPDPLIGCVLSASFHTSLFTSAAPFSFSLPAVYRSHLANSQVVSSRSLHLFLYLKPKQQGANRYRFFLVLPISFFPHQSSSFCLCFLSCLDRARSLGFPKVSQRRYDLHW